jgi:hypothetical protein
MQFPGDDVAAEVIGEGIPLPAQFRELLTPQGDLFVLV